MAKSFVSKVLNDHNVVLGGGQGELTGKIFPYRSYGMG